MWRPPGPLRLWRNSEGDSFLKSTFVGADECLPTIAACSCRGRELPDHGEAWSAEWILDQEALTRNLIVTRVRLPRSPFLFERSITLLQNKVLFDYRLTNTGNVPEPWLWAIHPLLSLEPGDQLELPPSVAKLLVYVAQGPDFPAGSSVEWPGRRDGVDLEKFRLGSETSYLKAFAGPLHEGWARIFNSRTNDSLTFQWDIVANPCLGIWLTRGGFNGWHHPAIEPTNAATDSLADAIRDRTASTLAPGATQSWRVELICGAA